MVLRARQNGGGKIRNGGGRGAGNGSPGGRGNSGGGFPSATITWNSADKSADVVLSSSDRLATNSGTNAVYARTNLGRSSGKWYFELTFNPSGGLGFLRGGVANSSYSPTTTLGDDTTGIGMATGGIPTFNTSAGPGVGGFGANTIIMVAVDFSASKIWFGKTGVWTGDPAAGTGEAFASLPSGILYPVFYGQSGWVNMNMLVSGNTANITYSVPSGFTVWGNS